jgi:hypothetical protein
MVTRAAISFLPFVTGVVLLLGGVTDGHDGWGYYVWPLLWIFFAWRFAVMGMQVSSWGVRILNPLMTWSYPWSKIDRFELVSTGELFARHNVGIALVTVSGRQRLVWSFTTSRLLPSRFSPGTQEEVLERLNSELRARVDA